MTEDPKNPKIVNLNRVVDATRYGVRIDLAECGGIRSGNASVSDCTAQETLETSIAFDTTTTPLFTFAEARAASMRAWEKYWTTGATIDLSYCTDPRAEELERRIVLSEYLAAIHGAGQNPAQETGLLCNSWYGKFHLEMHWWHSVHFTAWNRRGSDGRCWLITSSWSRRATKQQGFRRTWPKMTSPEAGFARRLGRC